MRVYEAIAQGFNTQVEVKTLKEVQQDCYPLPESYEWCNLNMNDPTEA